MKSRLVLLACCLALLSSCGQGDKGTGKAPEFAVIEAKTTTANLTNSYPATIKGKQDVEIRPMVSGFITKLHVDEGATVRKGQVLFSIDPVQYQAAAVQTDPGIGRNFFSCSYHFSVDRDPSGICVLVCFPSGADSCAAQVFIDSDVFCNCFFIHCFIILFF